MAEHFFALPGHLKACFETACPLGQPERLQLGAYIPGIAPIGRDEIVDIGIEHRMDGAPELVDCGNFVRLTTPRSEHLPADLYHLFYGVARRAWMREGLYPVHGACIGGKDGAHTLIVGHSGSGKTSLAQRLVDADGMTLFSGNKTLIRFDDDGSMTAVAGTQTMTALDESLDRRAYLLPPGKYTAQAEVPVRGIALIRVNDGVEEAQVLNPQSALHTLYPYFLDAVNGDVIVNGKQILDGTPGPEIKADLIGKLSGALSRAPVQKISGSMDFLRRMSCLP